MKTLDLFAANNEVQVINNEITVENILLSEADENQLLNAISDNNVYFEPFTETEKTKGISLQQLAESADIVDIKGTLSNEINAYQLINQVTSICNEYNLMYEIKDLFVADNKNKALGNGISINKQLCEAYQTENQTTNIPFKAVTFNRVFANINLNDMSNSTHIANIVVASNQKGLQVAIGANCYACRNQTILGAKNMASTYGTSDKIKNISDFITRVREMIRDYSFDRDVNILNKMKQIRIDTATIYQMIGELTAIRCAYDSKIKTIKGLINSDVYPLNQSQICKFTESLLLTFKNKGTLSLYDVYQSATALYKVASMDLPNVLPQNNAFASYLNERYNLDM
ncbi:hypothetical protein [Bacteroides congonensis]|uniref:hypothetical protein n=1 Tax=Bacteroides congonensis TaxID=1871006 RepID=UPI000934FFEA|nr:hypothetical protein [Bacteroides congonensis]